MAKQYKLGVRVVSRYGRSDIQHGLHSADDVQRYLDEMVSEGWRLMGQPQFTGIDGYLTDEKEGFRLMFFWERGT